MTTTSLGVPSGRAKYACRPWIVVTVPDGVPSLTEPLRQSGQVIPDILDVILLLNSGSICKRYAQATRVIELSGNRIENN
jgi:hypothetical protein